MKCLVCGSLVSLSKKSLRSDKHEGNNKNSSYQAIKHFETVFKSLFVSPSEHVPASIKEEL
jgi:hypothetical protein